MFLVPLKGPLKVIARVTIWESPEVTADAAPTMQAMELADADVTPDMMLLEALRLLKAQDESLTFRHSCGEGVCGSDAMNINGRNGLACITPLVDLKQPITIRPLPGMPVIRDLVVDLREPHVRLGLGQDGNDRITDGSELASCCRYSTVCSALLSILPPVSLARAL